jgi:hypothetical protein
MTFLNPLVLLGLAAAGIPLLIHLFQFQQPKTVDFSSIAFIQALEESAIRRMRVKRWLLLVLRTLAIISLVLAFARPTLTGQVASTVGGRANASIAVIVDNSLSMTLRSADGSYLQQAKTAARQVVEEMQSDDELFLGVTAGNTSTFAHFGTRSAALEAVDQISSETGAEPLARTVRRAAARLEDARHVNKEIYILSDLQRSSLVDTLRTEIPEDIRVGLIPVNADTHSNVAVTDVQVVSRILEAGQPVEMQATLANYGPETLEGYVASVFLEGDRVAQEAVTLEPGIEETVSFTVTPQHRGWLAGRVEAESDAFEPDNQRRFTLHIPERREVLIVAGEDQSTEYLELVFSSELASGQGVFATTTIGEEELPAQVLEENDAVFLVGVRDLSSGEIESLTRYVDSGGGVLFFPAQQGTASDYNRWLSRLEAGTFSGFSGSLGSREPAASTERVDLEHPMFRTIFDATTDREERQVEEVLVSFAMNYSPGRGNEHTLIHLSNGRPFLHEIQYGRGRVLLSAVAPDPAWSDLPMRGLFVPLVYRGAYYLAAGSDSRQATYTLGADRELRVTGRSGEESFRIVGPDGDEFIPEQRTLPGRTHIPLDQIQAPGIYELLQGEQLVRRLALNTQVSESDIRMASVEVAVDQLEQSLGRPVERYDRFDGRSTAQLRETVRHQRFGVELWNVFLLIALACIAGEMVVAKHQPSRQPVAGPS